MSDKNNKDEILKKIKDELYKLYKGYIATEEITPETKLLDDLGLCYFKRFDLCREFDIDYVELSVETDIEIKSIGDLISLICGENIKAIDDVDENRNEDELGLFGSVKRVLRHWKQNNEENVLSNLVLEQMGESYLIHINVNDLDEMYLAGVEYEGYESFGEDIGLALGLRVAARLEKEFPFSDMQRADNFIVIRREHDDGGSVFYRLHEEAKEDLTMSFDDYSEKIEQEFSP